MTDAPVALEQRPGSTSTRRAAGVMVVSFVVLAGMYVLFVRTAHGQRLDEAAVARLGQDQPVRATLRTVHQWVTVALVALSVGACLVLTAVRRRWLHSAGAATILVGANLTTEILKHRVLPRPDFGYGVANSYPSGHITVASSCVFAVLLLVPANRRWVVELAGSIGVALIGVGAVVAAFHVPSDIIGGLAVTSGWGAFVLAVVSTAGADDDVSERPRSTPAALLLGLAIAAGVFVVIGVRPGRSVKDLLVVATTMSGLAVAGAVAVGIFVRLLASRVR